MVRSRLLRAVLAFIALPGLVAFLVPIAVMWRPARSFHVIALVPLLAGITLLAWCVRNFYVFGQGTLAPWDPPRNLVESGPYRMSRNPMYLAVVLVLLGWSIGFQSRGHFVYAVVVAMAFHLRVVFSEEPWLARTHPHMWARYSARVPRWLFPSRRSLLVAVAAVVAALPLAGLLYESYVESRAGRELPAPGTFVDIGGKRLHLLCIGEGEPTVLFEASGFGVSSTSAAAVRERVATRARVCSYDRLGMGWSDPGPGTLTAGELARQLAVLQDRAGLRGPYLLVGTSMGGLTIEMFARRYPERSAGLVFLDAASSGALPRLERWFGPARAGIPVLALAARFGVIRLLDPFGISTDTDAGRRSAAMTYSAGAISTLSAVVKGLRDTQREFAEAPPLRSDIPLAVLSASDPHFLEIPGFEGFTEGLSPMRVEVHRQLAKQSTRGSWQMVPESTHLIASSNPDTVSEVVLSMLDAMR
jgi:protein-S-isoprenylcysteine O-methyltransferase Ste14/pimeloyl-ACP methyl ester carboxylesterase